MAKIVGGEVSYGRTVKTGDYENKRADVKLSFAVEDGDTFGDIVERAGDEARVRVYDMLDLNLPPKLKGEETPEVPATPSKRPDNKLETALKEKTKADLEAEQTAKLDAKVKKEKAAPKSEAAPAPAKEKAVASEGEGEDLGGTTFDEDAEENQPDVTGEVMSQAMNAAVARLNKVHGGAAPKLVKALIATFVEPPKKSHDIPQKMRHEFLKKLAELK